MATRTAVRDIEGRDSVGLYLDEIARNELLDAAQEVELSKAIEAGLMAESLLKQGRYSTLSFEEEAVAVYAGGKGFLDDVPVSDVVRFRNELIEFLRASHADVLKKIHDDAKFTPESEAALNAAIDAFKAQFVA